MIDTRILTWKSCVLKRQEAPKNRWRVMAYLRYPLRRMKETLDRVRTVRPATVRLESWKEIASYLRRGVRTVQRWEREEGLPVHRLAHAKRGTVYADREELGIWWERRQITPGAKQVAEVSGKSGPRSEKSVAVLYFANLGGDKEDEYFRDGMTEDIITDLAKIKELQVLPRSAVLAFRDKPLPATQFGQQFAAAYVLDGSVRRAGSRLRITTQLSETRTGHSVWAERYDRQVEDVFAIQNEIAQNIAFALRVMLTEKERREIEKVPTSAVQAYDYYLRGRQFFYQMRRKGFEFARQMFAEAIVIDPGYARAYAGAADCCSLLYLWFGAGEDDLREAIAASRRAVELDPKSAEAHASRGLAGSLSKNYEDAKKEFETSIRLNPHLFEAYYFYGRVWFVQGQFEKAADLFAKAAHENSDDYEAHAMRGGCLRALGREEEARQARRDSLRAAERHLQLHPDDVRAVYLGANALYELGERTLALEWASRALFMEPEEPSVLYNVACAYALLGETDKSLDCLENAFGKGFFYREWIVNDPDFTSLRSNPRFYALVERLTADRSKSAL